MMRPRPCGRLHFSLCVRSRWLPHTPDQSRMHPTAGISQSPSSSAFIFRRHTSTFADVEEMTEQLGADGSLMTAPYQVMPALLPEERAELKADIAARAA